jgi:hypothetical protein
MRILLGCVVMIVGLVGQSAGQVPFPMRGEAAERIEQYKKMRMIESLKLDEETSIRFFARYGKHQEEMRNAASRRDSLVRELERLRRQNATESEYVKIVDALQGSERQSIEIRSRFVEELRTLLSARQIAEYIIFERRFYENLRELMQDMQRGRQERRNR